jgi:glycosyltransferase involved in cell wall biosynthesis
LYQGLVEIGVKVQCAHFESAQEKEWYYQWFKPDVVVGIGYWKHTPKLTLHPLRYGIQPVPWLVEDGSAANYLETFNNLPLTFVTSNWMKKTYIKDGINGDSIEVLPMGCDTNAFIPRDSSDPKVLSIRKILGITPDQLMLLTVGGDATSKGVQEALLALSIIDAKAPDWKFVCKVWPLNQARMQNLHDLQLATDLGIDKKVCYTTNIFSREFMPYLMAACDIYVAPSRLEGYGVQPIEANACEKPVLGISAMGFLDTMVHGKTALLARVAQKIVINETIIGEENGCKEDHKPVSITPRVVGYRANINDIADYLLELMSDPNLRRKIGKAGRRRVIKNFDHKIVARKFLNILKNRLDISIHK